MRRNYKSVLAVALSVGMVFQAPLVALANEGDSQETPASEETTEEVKQADSNAHVGYDVGNNGFNAFGVNDSNGSGQVDDGEKIYTTFSDRGYTTAVQVGDESTTNLPGGNSFQYGTEYDNNGVKTSIVADIGGADSEAVTVTYTLTNETGEDKTVKVGSNADTQIGNNDNAPCSFIGDGVGIQMTDGTNTFVLLPVGDDFTTSWYGRYGERLNNQFVDLDKSTETYTGDSGIAWSWTVDVPSGGTVTRQAVLAAGQLTIINVSYDANGGEGEMKGNVVIDGFNNGITLKNSTYTKDGYSFDGWSLNADGSGDVYQAGETYHVTSAQQFYALWKLLAPDAPIPAPEVVEEIISGGEPTSEPQEVQVVPATDGFTIITTQAQEALPTKELGNAEAVTRTAKVDISKVTPAQYRDIVKATVDTVPTFGVAVIETNEVSVLDANMVEIMASRPDVAVNIIFMHDGVKKRVVIPAGYDVRSLLDENGYCGFLRLASLLGFTVLEN